MLQESEDPDKEIQISELTPGDVVMKEKAREQADMIRALLFKKNDAEPTEKGKFITYDDVGRTIEKEFTIKDYQEMSDFVKKLEIKFKDEPKITENLFKIGRGLQNLLRVVGYPIAETDVVVTELKYNMKELVHALDNVLSPYTKTDLAKTEHRLYDWIHKLDNDLAFKLMDLKKAKKITKKYREKIKKEQQKDKNNK